MNVYSSDVVLSALAETCFPDTAAGPALYSVGGHTFRLLQVDGVPQTTAPYVDFWEPVADRGEQPLPLSYLPRVALDSLDAWSARPAVPERGGLAPYVEWSRVSSEAEFSELIASRSRKHAADSRRQRRRVEREVGALTYTYDDPETGLLEQCLRWKHAQKPRSNHLQSDSRPTSFLRALRSREVLKVSTLRGGDHVLAVHLGLADAGRFYSLVPAYDAAFHQYSPGRLLLDHLLETSLDRDRQFDFLIGNENYKWLYATDVRIVEPIGRTPWSTSATHQLRKLKRSVRKRLRPRTRR
jgi:hypothetical protein